MAIVKDLVKFQDVELKPVSAFNILDIDIKFKVCCINAREIIKDFEELGSDKFFSVLKLFNLPFYMQDILGVYISRPDLIVPTMIYNIIYETADFDAYDIQLHKKIIETMSSWINVYALMNGEEKGNYLITIYDGASTVEFPEDKWYLEEEDKEDGKELLPINDILERNGEAIEAAGFASINDYCTLEFHNPYVYIKNDHGADFKMAVNLVYGDKL